MSINKELLILSQRIRALSQNGLTYSQNDYDTERYRELTGISNDIAGLLTGHSPLDIDSSYKGIKEYTTPKVDIRAIVFNDKDELLMVREQADELWSVPGGWADVGYTPKEIAVKEVQEETGLNVRAERLLAVMDMKCHPHPSIPFYVYKFFILCEIIDGRFSETFDILDKGFFPLDQLPPLSTERVLPGQIQLMYRLKKNPALPVWLD